MKFFDLINKTKDTAELYIYGEIVSGDKWEDDDVTISEFKESLENLGDNVKTLNMYTNSPGGNVFVTVAMMSQLERIKDRITINAYIDGIAASAASFLVMKAHNIYMYKSSLMMVHKPMIGLLFGANASVLREKAEWLDKVEQSTCIPAYMEKGTEHLTEQKLNEMLENETWLTADEVAEFFNVQIIEETRDVVACVDENVLNMFSNPPKTLVDGVKNKQETISKDELELRQKIANEAKASNEITKTILGGIYS